MLEEILVTAGERAVEARERREAIEAEAAGRSPALSFTDALCAPGLSVVAEIKRKSPSKGDLAPSLDPVAQASAYMGGGAAAISVLTEPHFFAGSIDDLVRVRRTVDIPVLRKDFTVDPIQIIEARAAGADAVLLIVAALADGQLAELVAAAASVGVDALVETHAESEVERAVAAGARIIGVNNRDLTTFATDLGVAERAATVLPDGVVRVAESGVSTIEGAQRMADAGYDAILVGEALVRSADPALLLERLRSVR